MACGSRSPLGCRCQLVNPSAQTPTRMEISQVRCPIYQVGNLRKGMCNSFETALSNRGQGAKGKGREHIIVEGPPRNSAFHMGVKHK